MDRQTYSIGGSDTHQSWPEDVSSSVSGSMPETDQSHLPPSSYWPLLTFVAGTFRRVGIWRNELVHSWYFRKPNLVQELVCLGAAATIGSAILITLLYVFIFIIQPQALRNVASETFTSKYPKTSNGQPYDGLSRWTEDFSREVIPIMCHSHNDYWREYPLYSALAAGCTGVEADVFLSDDGSDVLVGHDRDSLSPGKSLRSLYLDPLLDILNTINPPDRWSNFTRTDRPQGVFRSQPNMTVVLLLDVKDDASKTWPVVMQQLQPLREKLFLTRFEIVAVGPGLELRQHDWPGPVTIVGTGNLLEDRTTNLWPNASSYTYYHDAFLDAPLEILPQDNRLKYWGGPDGGLAASVMWDKDDAYYTSVSFQQSIGSVIAGFSDKQLEKLRRQIFTAKWSGLKTRYWDLPSWPISYRDYVWEVLTREGADMLNVDDLKSASKRSWTTGYIRNLILMISMSVLIFLGAVALAWYGYRAIKKQVAKLTASQPIMLE